jgi:hypothetical protein
MPQGWCVNPSTPELHETKYYEGAKISGASPAYNVEEMSYAMRTADSKFLFTAPSSMEIATASAQAVNLPKSKLFLLEGTLEGYSTVHGLC